MKINIYYGGRGLLDDPTLYVLKKMQNVFTELRVTVERYNIFEYKNSISTLPQTMKDADGIILATTVEWLGIGGFMYQFLDACWLYGDKEKIQSLYINHLWRTRGHDFFRKRMGDARWSSLQRILRICRRYGRF